MNQMWGLNVLFSIDIHTILVFVRVTNNGNEYLSKLHKKKVYGNYKLSCTIIWYLNVEMINEWIMCIFVWTIMFVTNLWRDNMWGKTFNLFDKNYSSSLELISYNLWRICISLIVGVYRKWWSYVLYVTNWTKIRSINLLANDYVNK